MIENWELGAPQARLCCGAPYTPLYSAPRLAFGKGRYARPPAGGCPSALRAATSPEGRGKDAPMQV